MTAGSQVAELSPDGTATVESAIRTYEKIVTRLEEAINATPPEGQGTPAYSRLLANYRDTTTALADLRARQAEQQATAPTSPSGPNGHGLSAWWMTICLIDTLKRTRDSRVLTPEQANHVWHALIDEGFLDYTGMTANEALAAHRGAIDGQIELDAPGQDTVDDSVADNP